MTYDMVRYDQSANPDMLPSPSARDQGVALSSSIREGREEAEDSDPTEPHIELLRQIGRLQQIVAELLMENERLRQARKCACVAVCHRCFSDGIGCHPLR